MSPFWILALVMNQFDSTVTMYSALRRENIFWKVITESWKLNIPENTMAARLILSPIGNVIGEGQHFFWTVNAAVNFPAPLIKTGIESVIEITCIRKHFSSNKLSQEEKSLENCSQLYAKQMKLLADLVMHLNPTGKQGTLKANCTSFIRPNMTSVWELSHLN